MIEGIKIDMPSDELITHLRERAEHHKERAQWYSSQVKSLRDGGLDRTAVSNDPVTSLEHSISTHLNRAAFFSFMSEHIVKDETYRLTENDLQRLDILSSYR